MENEALNRQESDRQPSEIPEFKGGTEATKINEVIMDTAIKLNFMLWSTQNRNVLGVGRESFINDVIVSYKLCMEIYNRIQSRG